MALKMRQESSLNPYSIGRYSLSQQDCEWYRQNSLKSLNPYSIGRYSLSTISSTMKQTSESLNPYSIGRYSLSGAILADNEDSAFAS